MKMYHINLIYVDSTQGWVNYSSYSQSTLNQLYTVNYLVVAGGGKMVALISHLRPVADYVDTVLHVRKDDVFGSRITVLRGEERFVARAANARLTPDEDAVTFIELRGNASVEGGGGALEGMTARDIDLDYTEDSACETDMNVVVTGDGKFVEVQGSGEESTFSQAQLDGILVLAQKGLKELSAMQAAFLTKQLLKL